MTEPAAAPAISTAQPEDFFQLLKPRVMSLVIFTAVTGLVVADGEIGWLSAAIAVLCIAAGPWRRGGSGRTTPWPSGPSCRCFRSCCWG